VVAALFGRKLGIGLVLDEGAEGGRLALELARLVARGDPVEDVLSSSLLAFLGSCQ